MHMSNELQRKKNTLEDTSQSVHELLRADRATETFFKGYI